MKRSIPNSRLIGFLVLMMTAACSPRMGENDVVAIDNRVFDHDLFFDDVVESLFVNLNSEDRQKVIDEFAKRQIVTVEAGRRGLLDDVATQKASARFRANLIVDNVLEEEVWSRLLSDSSLGVLYGHMGRSVYVSHIVVTFKGSRYSKSDRSEFEALEVIKEIQSLVERGEIKFYEAARKYSEDPSRSNNGVLGQFRWGELFEPVQSLAFSTKSGKVAGPVRSEVGYHLVRVTGIQDVTLPPYDQMIPELKRFMRSNKGHEFDLALEAFEKRLERRYAVKFNPEMIFHLLRAVAEVHGDSEGYPTAKLIEKIDLPGIICVAGGVPIELAWFREQINLLGPPLSNSLILSERTLVTTLEHVLYRHLTQKLAEQTRQNGWFVDIDEKVEKNRPRILQKVLVDEISSKRPGTPRDKLLQEVVERHRIRVNDDFIANYRTGETRI